MTYVSPAERVYIGDAEERILLEYTRWLSSGTRAQWLLAGDTFTVLGISEDDLAMRMLSA